MVLHTPMLFFTRYNTPVSIEEIVMRSIAVNGKHG